MRYIFIYFFFLLPVHADITHKDIINVINKVDSYGIVPKSLIEHAKEEAKSLKQTDLKQINAASKAAKTIQKEKLPATKTKEGLIPDSVKKDLESIKENAKKRQELLESIVEE